MAILGLGTDIVEIARIEKACARHAKRFAMRVLTPAEFTIFESATNPSRYLAKRFAVKEAAAKALGTGIAQGVSFQHFHTQKDAAGKPLLHFSGTAEILAKEKGVSQIWLTIADEKHYAVATVILT